MTANFLLWIARKHRKRDGATVAAHASRGDSYQLVAGYSGVHFTTAGDIVRATKSQD